MTEETISIKEMIKSELKKEGLNMLEEDAIKACKILFKLLPKVALKTETKVDDMFIPVIGIMEPKVMELLDKIDGEVG